MHIVMVTPKFHPHVGGVEKHVLRVSEELRTLGHQVSIITELHEAHLPSEEDYQGLKIHRVPRRSLWSTWLGMWGLRRVFESADIIHCHDHHTLVGWIPHLRFRFWRQPFFVTFHGYEACPPRWHHRLIRRTAVALSKAHLCIGGYIGKWYRGPCDVVRWGGVDLPAQRPSPGEPNHVVFIGRLDHDTEILGYLEAIEILRARGIELQVDICGDGPLRNHVEAWAARLGPGVRVHGHVPAVEPFLLRARFAFVSRYLAILEAMAYGRMVFALYSNPIRRDYLLSIPEAEDKMIVSGYPEALADAFEEVLKNPQNEREYIRASEVFVTEQTWRSFAEAYLDLYRGGTQAAESPSVRESPPDSNLAR